MFNSPEFITTQNIKMENGQSIQDMATIEGKNMALFYFKNEDSRRQAISMGFKDGVNWLLQILSERKNDNKPFIAKGLRDEGYTIREIAKIMGFKHPGSISNLLKSYK